MMIESANFDIGVVNSIKAGKDAIGTLNKQMDIDKIAELKDEMDDMKGKTFKVVKKAEAFKNTGKAPISTTWVDTDKSHGNGEMLVGLPGTSRGRTK